MTSEKSITPPRALIFDWDNTLIDTWSLIHKALEDTFTRYDLPPWTLEETRQRVRQSARETFPKLFGDRANEAIRLYSERYRHWSAQELTPLSDAESLLSLWSARGRGPLSVVSNKQGIILRDEAARLGWDGYFHRLIGATDAPADKPDVAPVVMALEGSGIAPGPDVWFIGDTDIDMICANNAGCTAVFLGPESVAAEMNADVSLNLGDLAGLWAVIDAHGFLNP